MDSLCPVMPPLWIQSFILDLTLRLTLLSLCPETVTDWNSRMHFTDFRNFHILTFDEEKNLRDYSVSVRFFTLFFFCLFWLIIHFSSSSFDSLLLFFPPPLPPKANTTFLVRIRTSSPSGQRARHSQSAAKRMAASQTASWARK